jgi:hypothetical protein
VRVCFHEVQPLREQREYAVLEAAMKERVAWQALEDASRPKHADENLLQMRRERWQEAARSLVSALINLKR